MLYEIGKAVKALIESNFKGVEFYEGQFENFEEQIVNPPWCYIDISSGRPGDARESISELDIKLYVMTSRMTHDPGNMLDLLEDTIAAVHEKPVRYDTGSATSTPPAVYVGRCFTGPFRALVIYPGLSVWEMQVTVKLSRQNL